MSLLKLEVLEDMIHELDFSSRAEAVMPQRFLINYQDDYALSSAERAPVKPARFSIRVPKYALQGDQLSNLFRKIRELYPPEEQCLLMNDGDQGVIIEGEADLKHKALIALWEMGIYNFRFTYKYDLVKHA
jgi:hypothetical protein